MIIIKMGMADTTGRGVTMVPTAKRCSNAKWIFSTACDSGGEAFFAHK